MFDISIKTHFSAGHHLRNYPGNCEKPHGHNWTVEVTVRAEELNNLGIGIDFKTLKNEVNKVLDNIDHCNLNEHPAFQLRNPSSENIAVYLFDCLKDNLRSSRYSLYSIKVKETEKSGIIYYGR